MLKDIIEPAFDGVGVAAVYEEGEEKEMVWNVYLINFNNAMIDGVLVSSKGYGTINNEEVKTSVLRHMLNEVDSLDYGKIEPLHEDLFILNNEYWVSFYLDGKIYDRKFVFVANTIDKSRLKPINVIDKNGILIM
ncbi:MAG: hypothetical protein ACOYMA_17675 [Bacteroidia bacterium]